MTTALLVVIAAGTTIMAAESVVFAVQRWRKHRSERRETLALAEQIRQARIAAEAAATVQHHNEAAGETR